MQSAKKQLIIQQLLLQLRAAKMCHVKLSMYQTCQEPSIETISIGIGGIDNFGSVLAASTI